MHLNTKIIWHLPSIQSETARLRTTSERLVLLLESPGKECVVWLVEPSSIHSGELGSLYGVGRRQC